jgi:hypothetical protein
MARTGIAPLPPETLQQLEAVRIATGLSVPAFGRTYFGDVDLLRSMRQGASPFAVTRQRIESLLEMAAAGDLPTAPRRALSAEVYPIIMEAVAASDLSEGQFSARYLGHGWVINPLRKKPWRLKANTTAKVEAACTAVLGRPINFTNSPE